MDGHDPVCYTSKKSSKLSKISKFSTVKLLRYTVYVVAKVPNIYYELLVVVGITMISLVYVCETQTHKKSLRVDRPDILSQSPIPAVINKLCTILATDIQSTAIARC